MSVMAKVKPYKVQILTQWTLTNRMEICKVLTKLTMSPVAIVTTRLSQLTDYVSPPPFFLLRYMYIGEVVVLLTVFGGFQQVRYEAL